MCLRVQVHLRNGRILDRDAFDAMMDGFKEHLRSAPTLREKQAVLQQVDESGVGRQYLRDLRRAFYSGLSEADALRAHLDWLLSFDDIALEFVGATAKGREALAWALPVLGRRFAAEPRRNGNVRLRATYAVLFGAAADAVREAEPAVWASMRNVSGLFAVMTCIDYLAIRPQDAERRPARMRSIAAAVADMDLRAEEACRMAEDLRQMAMSRRRADPFRQELEGLQGSLEARWADHPDFGWKLANIPVAPPRHPVPGLAGTAMDVWRAFQAGRPPWWA